MTTLDRIGEIIADTFDFSGTVDASTQAEDVDGWDSLAHTVLMVRLQNAFGVKIPEDLASSARNVGELAAGIDRLLTAKGA